MRAVRECLGVCGYVSGCVPLCSGRFRALTVPINISIKAELSPESGTPIFLSAHRRLPLSFLSTLFFPSLFLLLFRRYRNVFSSTHRVVFLSVAEGLYVSGEITDRAAASSG